MVFVSFGESTKTAQTILEIKKAEGKVTILDDISKTYDGSRVETPQYTFLGTGYGYIEYKVKDADDSTYSEAIPIYAGDYTVRITVQEDYNYLEAFETKDFTIFKQKVAKPTVENLEYYYTGSNVQIDIPTDYRYVVTGDVGKLASQNYVAIISLDNEIGEVKYCWDDEENSTSPYEIRWSIEPLSLENAIVTLDGTALTENGEQLTQKVKTVKVGDITLVEGVDYKVTDNVNTVANVYALKILPTKNELEFFNYKGEVIVKYVILPKNDDEVVEEEKDGKKVALIGDGTISVDVNKGEEKSNATKIETQKITVIESVLLAQELSRVANGENVEIWVEVKDNDLDIEKTAKEQIEEVMKVAYSNYKIGYYFDISIYKKFESDYDKELVPTLNNNIKVSIVAPNSMVNNLDSYYVVRNHDGEVEILDCNYDKSTKTFTFETDKFSYYALIYSEKSLNNLSWLPWLITAILLMALLVGSFFLLVLFNKKNNGGKVNENTLIGKIYAFIFVRKGKKNKSNDK